MKILDFIEKTELSEKNECEKAKLLCYFYYKENSETLFSMSLISDLFVQCGFNVPNSSRLKNKLIKGKEKAFSISKEKTTTIEFDIVNIGLHFILKNVRPYAAPCSEA